MKTNLFAIPILLVMILNVDTAFGQRFTSKGQTPRSVTKPDTGFINAERSYLALKAGDLDNAREYLSSADPSNPFSMYVRAALTQDATQAAGIYRSIVNGYPDKPIAREALLQLYKYHYAAGDYRLAHTDFLQLRKYPGMSQLVDPAGLSDKMPTEKDTLQNPVVTSRPQVETVPSKPIQKESPVQSGESYAVQLGVFSTRANAEKFVNQMKTNNIEASVSTKTGASKTLFVVTSGDFQSREAAEAFAADLKSKSINCIVINTGESRE